MRTFFVTILCFIAVIAMAVSTQGAVNTVTWAPFTKDFKLVAFTTQLDMTYFGTDQFEYDIALDISGLTFQGNMIDITAAAWVSSGSGAWSGSNTDTVKSAKSYRVTCPKSPIGGTYRCSVTVFLPVTKIDSPAVKVTVTSADKTKTVADPTSYTGTPATSFGSLTMTTFKNSTDPFHDEPGFVIKIENFIAPSAEQSVFTITDEGAYSGVFVQRSDNPKTLCTINGASVVSSIQSSGLKLQAAGLDAIGNSLEIKCPTVGFDAGFFGGNVITATLIEKAVPDKKYYSQTVLPKVSHGFDFTLFIIVFIAIIAVGAIAGAVTFFVLTKKKNQQEVIHGSDSDYGSF
jgi:hypothetical protein